MGLGTIGWGFSKTDGVPVGLVESQWGRLSVGMLQGVEPAKMWMAQYYWIISEEDVTALLALF